MSRRVVWAVCAIALTVAAGCGYPLPRNTPVFVDLGFSMNPTGCAGNVDNVGNTCYMRDLDAVALSGARWARIDDSWSWVERNRPGPRDKPQADCVTVQRTNNCWYWTSI